MFSLTECSLYRMNSLTRVASLKTASDKYTNGYLYRIVKIPPHQQPKEGKVRDTSGEWNPTKEEVLDISDRLHAATFFLYHMTLLKPSKPQMSVVIFIDPLLTCTEILQVLCDRARLFNKVTTTVISVYHRRETTRVTRTLEREGEQIKSEFTQDSFTLSNPNWPSAFRVDVHRCVSRPVTAILKFNKDVGNMYCPDDADYFEVH